MSDPQVTPEQPKTDFSSHETRIHRLENIVANDYARAKNEVVGFWPKVNSAWQWVHGELYHWTSHAKEIGVALAALGVFLVCCKAVGII